MFNGISGIFSSSRELSGSLSSGLRQPLSANKTYPKLLGRIGLCSILGLEDKFGRRRGDLFRRCLTHNMWLLGQGTNLVPVEVFSLPCWSAPQIWAHLALPLIVHLRKAISRAFLVEVARRGRDYSLGFAPLCAVLRSAAQPEEFGGCATNQLSLRIFDMFYLAKPCDHALTVVTWRTYVSQPQGLRARSHIRLSVPDEHWNITGDGS